MKSLSFRTAEEPTITPKVSDPLIYLIFQLRGFSNGLSIIATYHPIASNPMPVFVFFSSNKNTISLSLIRVPCPIQNHVLPGSSKNDFGFFCVPL